MNDKANLVIAIVAGAVILFNLFATYVVFRCASYTTERKALQTILVWLVPLAGAIICIMFARTDTHTSPTGKPREFYDNADSSGSDH